VIARCGEALRHCLREPEWAVYSGLVLAAAAMGDADLWRYLAYLLPAAAVLFAVCVQPVALQRRHMMITAAAVCIATVVTQCPLQTIDLGAYFLDWFPYYIQQGENVPLPTLPPLWPLWEGGFL
jgi:hypothetical protein